MWKNFLDFMDKYVGSEARLRGPILLVLTLLALWFGYRITVRALRRYMDRRAHKPENVANFLLIYRYVWMSVGFVFCIIGLSGSLAGLGLSAAFLGMVIGWSLQAPVTGIAAWLMIILKRPFRIGDRIIIAGIIGDVTDINLTHIVLNQVGGTVGGEEKSGRGVLIPNATLFQQIIHNYTLDSEYILDEVLVRLTFDSDFELAEKLCIDAARDATPEIIEATNFQPTIRCELFESGVLVRLRYQTIPAERQLIHTKITRRVLKAFSENYPKVSFCFPHQVIRFRPHAADDVMAHIPSSPKAEG